MCIDYCALNKVTIKNAYKIPRIDEILDSLSVAKIFPTLDAPTRHYYLAVNKSYMDKTAFSWRGGQYEFTSIPFGLCNVPATFQRAMDRVFDKERRNM